MSATLADERKSAAMASIIGLRLEERQMRENRDEKVPG
jgi:hypothetical protein